MGDFLSIRHADSGGLPSICRLSARPIQDETTVFEFLVFIFCAGGKSPKYKHATLQIQTAHQVPSCHALNAALFIAGHHLPLPFLLAFSSFGFDASPGVR
jgi:hypothetical protein